MKLSYVEIVDRMPAVELPSDGMFYYRMAMNDVENVFKEAALAQQAQRGCGHCGACATAQYDACRYPHEWKQAQPEMTLDQRRALGAAYGLLISQKVAAGHKSVYDHAAKVIYAMMKPDAPPIL